MAAIVGRVTVSGPVYTLVVMDNFLYCLGDRITRVDLSNQTTTVVAPGMSALWGTLVDFHRPFDFGDENTVGHGAPDRRIYVSCIDTAADDAGIGVIIPVLGNQFTWNRVYESDEGSPFDPSSLPAIYSVAAAPSGKVLYLYDIDALTIAGADLGNPNPHVTASIEVNSYVPKMVVSPDDRFIYATNPTDDIVRVIDTASWPPSTRKVKVSNGPYGLALSADGKRLFVTGSGWGPAPSASGALSVIDTVTLQVTQVAVSGKSFGVAVNAAGTLAYVPNNDGDSVAVVDVSGAPFVRETLFGFHSPGDARLSTDERHLYVGHNPVPDDTEIAIVAL